MQLPFVLLTKLLLVFFPYCISFFCLNIYYSEDKQSRQVFPRWSLHIDRTVSSWLLSELPRTQVQTWHTLLLETLMFGELWPVNSYHMKSVTNRRHLSWIKWMLTLRFCNKVLLIEFMLYVELCFSKIDVTECVRSAHTNGDNLHPMTPVVFF